MKQFWKQLLIKQFAVNDEQELHLDAQVVSQKLKSSKISLRRHLKDSILIIAGIVSAAFGLKGFLLTNHFIDGGATGISLLVTAVTNIPLYLLIIGINLPFIFMGYKIMGKTFAIKTSLSITGLAIVLATVHFPNVTDDNLLVAVFGGFF